MVIVIIVKEEKVISDIAGVTCDKHHLEDREILDPIATAIIVREEKEILYFEGLTCSKLCFSQERS